MRKVLLYSRYLYIATAMPTKKFDFQQFPTFVYTDFFRDVYTENTRIYMSDRV